MLNGRLRLSSRRRSNSPDSKQNKGRDKKIKDSSTHLRSNSRETHPDKDVDKNQYMLRQMI